MAQPTPTMPMVKYQKQAAYARAVGIIGILLILGAAYWLGSNPLEQLSTTRYGGQLLAIGIIALGIALASVGFSQYGKLNAAYKDERTRIDTLLRRPAVAETPAVAPEKAAGDDGTGATRAA